MGDHYHWSQTLPAHLLTLTTVTGHQAPVFVMNIYSLLKSSHVLGTVVRPHGPVAGQGWPQWSEQTNERASLLALTNEAAERLSYVNFFG